MGLKFLKITGVTLMAVSMAWAQGSIKVSCVGNSITEGYGIWDKKKYPEHLQEMLGAEYQVENHGVSSQMFLKSSDQSYWNTEKFKSAYNFAPNIVVIELGTNDSKYFYKSNTNNFYYEYKSHTKESIIAEMKKDYEALLDTFLHQPQAPKIYATLQPYAQNEGWSITDSAIVNYINPIIEEVAKKKGVNIIDLHSSFSNPDWLLDDVVHPNEAGAKELAKIIADAIIKGPTSSSTEEPLPLSSSGQESPESSASVNPESSTDALVNSASIRPQVIMQNGFIQVNHFAGPISVFDMNGHLVKQMNSKGTARISIKNSGTYMVKTGRNIQKIFVK